MIMAPWPGIERINLKTNILTKKGFANFDIFVFDIIFFYKITKTILIVVAEEATDIFYELNGDNCFPQDSFDFSVFLFKEYFKCIED